jgi:hypothetical protein
VNGRTQISAIKENSERRVCCVRTPTIWSRRTAATSSAFAIFGPAAKLAFSVEPPTTVALIAVFSVQVTVQDAGGHRVETAVLDLESLRAYRRDFPAQLDADRFELVS